MRVVTTFDESVIRFLNGYARRVPEFDSLMWHLAIVDLLKGGLLVALIWWVWFNESPNRAKHRELLVSTMAGACGAMIISRILALGLPFRYRPVHDVKLEFVRPYGMYPRMLDGWSSFPSDHAALFFALAFGLFLVSRRIGVLAFMYTLIVILFPRVYLGLHYPSDILGGGVIAVAMVSLAKSKPIKRWTVPPTLSICERRPGVFYAGFMLFSAQLITLFADVRLILRAASDAVLSLILW